MRTYNFNLWQREPKSKQFTVSWSGLVTSRLKGCQPYPAASKELAT